MPRIRRAITAGTTVAATSAVALLVAAAAAGTPRTTTIDAAPAPGPKRYDEVFVLEPGKLQSQMDRRSRFSGGLAAAYSRPAS